MAVNAPRTAPQSKLRPTRSPTTIIYLKTAREADSKWNNTPQNAVGPIESRLNEFDTVLPFVFGYLGEVNKAVRLHLSARHPTKWFRIIQYLRAIRCSFLSVWNLRRLSPHQALSLASR